VKEYRWDRGDCVWFNEMYPTWILDNPNCDVCNPSRIGDGRCSGAEEEYD